MSASASKKKRKELEEQGLSPRAIAEQKAQEQKKKLLRNVLIVVLCVAVAAALIFGVISLVNRPTPPSYDTKAAVATVGEEKITVPVYDIFYNTNASSMYNYGYSYFITAGTPLSQQNYSFGEGTWEDVFKESAANAIQTAYNYYIDAKQNGYSLSDEQKDAIDQNVDAVKTAASNYGYRNVDRFLGVYYGEGVTLDDYKTFLEVNAYYEGYLAKLKEDFNPTAEELKDAYDKDTGAFDFVSYTYKTTEAEAATVPAENENKEEAGNAETETGAETEAGTEPETEAAPANTETVYTDEAKAAAKEKAESYLTAMPEDANTGRNHKSDVTNSFNEEVANWLFDAERKEGDSKVFTMKEDETAFVTIRFDSRDTNDYHCMKANVLTITKDKKDTELKEGEQSAKDKFDALLKAVEDGMSDDAFNEAVTALGYTVSTTSVNHASFDETVRSWLFDESRQKGDLKTDYENDTTYYLIRFVEAEKDTYRDTLVKDSLLSAKTEAIATANKIQIVEDMLQYANTDLTFNATSSES